MSTPAFDATPPTLDGFDQLVAGRSEYSIKPPAEKQIKRDAFLEHPLIEAEIELPDDCRIGDAAPGEAINVSTNSQSGEFDIATSALAVNGWCVVSSFLSQTQTQALATECMAMYAAQLLTPARVGANRAATLLRGDSTRWFQPDTLSPRQQTFADRIEALQNALSRDLFLGLVDSESHYAVYRPGTGYARHLDCLRNNDSRVISAVFYLNEEPWLRHIGLLAHGYSMSSHLIHKDADSIGMIWERSTRDEARRTAVSRGHSARVVSDACAFAKLRLFSLLRACGEPTRVLNDIDAKYAYLAGELDSANSHFTNVEYRRKT